MNAPGKWVHGLGGYLYDIYKMATCQMINPHSYLKYLTIDRARRDTNGRTFVETGTFLGGTAYRCSKVFERVYTIELDTELARRARQNLAGCQNVEVIQGDAMVELEKVFAARPVERAVVFLDGHFSGEMTAKGDIEEPAILELQVLEKHRNQISAIVIDDFRNFGEEPGHPPKWELLRAIDCHLPRADFNVQIQNDQVIITRRRLLSSPVQVP
jgi:hypothetical protein